MTTLSVKRGINLFFNLCISYSNSFLGFVIFLLLARLLGAIDYSVVAIGIAVGGFIKPLFDLGSAKTFVRDALSLTNQGDVEDLAQTSFNMRLTVVIVVSSILFLFCVLYVDDFVKAIAIAFISLWAGMLGLYPTSWFDYFHKTMYQNMCVMIERVLVVLFIGLLLWIKLEIQLLILVGVMLIILRCLSIFYQVKFWWNKYANMVFSFKPGFPLWNSPGTNIYFTIALLSNALLVYGSQLVLAGTGDVLALSTYSFAFQLVCLIFLFQSQAIRVLNRDISKVCQPERGSYLIKHLFFHLTFMILVSAVLALGVLFIAKYIPVILDDIRFVGLVEFVPLLCVWVIIAGAGQVITQYLLELKQEIFHLTTSIVSGLFSITLSLIFIPKYGAISIPIIMASMQSVNSGTRLLRLLYVSSSVFRRKA